MKWLVIIFTTFILASVSGVTNAISQSDHDPDIYVDRSADFDPSGSLDDYIAFALRNNPDIRSAYHAWEAKMALADKSAFLPDPVMSFGYFIDQVETRVGPQRYRFGIRQSIPWFGTLGARKHRDLQKAGASRQAYLSTKALVVLEVRTAWLELYRLAKTLDLVRADIEYLKGFESVALAGYRAGRVPHSDLLRVQVELAEVEERAFTLESEKDSAASRLREVLGLEDPVTIPDPADLPLFEDPPDWDSLKGSIVSRNPDIRALGYLVEKDAAAESLARKDYFPDMTVGFDYIETEEALDPSMTGSGKDPWGVSLSISIPLWFGRTKAAVRSASASERMNIYRKKAKENDVVAAAREAFNSWRDNERKTRLYELGIVPRTEQLLEATFTAYRGGSADFMDVIVSQRQLLLYRIRLLDSKVMSAKMISRLDYLAGFEGIENRQIGSGTGRQEG